MIKHPATFSTGTAQNYHQYCDTQFEHLIQTEGLAFRVNEGRYIPTELGLDLLSTQPGTVLADVVQTNGFRELLWRTEHNSTLVQFSFNPHTHQLTLHIAAPTLERRTRVAKVLRELFPAREIPPDREEVNVAFWSLTPNGARGMERTLAIAPWHKVEDNYTAQTKNSLGQLMDPTFRPTKAGQLVLWYGPPGTGKTHALRSLLWEWRKWCSFHYITDPEVFFGGNANYMLDVLLMRNDAAPSAYDDDDEPQPTLKSAESKWRLLILEDSGELMVPDAKVQTGQGLSRLLNVVDGLIGQGLKIMVLVTTNEILKKLHPAVARPGRCAARTEFGEFKKDEALRWLTANGAGAVPINAPGISLAELYAAIGDAQIISESKPMAVGFRE